MRGGRNVATVISPPRAGGDVPTPRRGAARSRRGLTRSESLPGCHCRSNGPLSAPRPAARSLSASSPTGAITTSAKRRSSSSCTRSPTRARRCSTAWRALVPGGHVFTLGGILADHGRRGPPDAERLYTPERVQHALRGFELLRCEVHAYEQEHSSGRRKSPTSWRLVAAVAAVGPPDTGFGLSDHGVAAPARVGPNTRKWVDGAARRTSILIAAPHSSLPPSRRATGSAHPQAPCGSGRTSMQRPLARGIRSGCRPTADAVICIRV